MNGQAHISLDADGMACNLPIALYEEQGNGDRKAWIARCPALGISSQGDTKPEAEEAVKEAIGMFIEDIVSRGKLDRVLVDELGWQRIAQPAGQPMQATGFFQPSPAETRDVAIRIPA